MERRPDYVDGVADMLQTAVPRGGFEPHSMPTGATVTVSLGASLVAEVVTLLREYSDHLAHTSMYSEDQGIDDTEVVE